MSRAESFSGCLEGAMLLTRIDEAAVFAPPQYFMRHMSIKLSHTQEVTAYINNFRKRLRYIDEPARYITRICSKHFSEQVDGEAEAKRTTER